MRSPSVQRLDPRDALVEVRFEDLERAPLEEIERIYDALALGGFGEARPAIAAYAEAKKRYQKNRYHLTPEEQARIAERWAGPIARWNYQPPVVE